MVTGTVASAGGCDLRAIRRHEPGSTTALFAFDAREVQKCRQQRPCPAMSVLAILVWRKVVALSILQEAHVLIQTHGAAAFERWHQVTHAVPNLIGQDGIHKLSDHVTICRNPVASRPERAKGPLLISPGSLTAQKSKKKQPSDVPQHLSFRTSSAPRTRGMTAQTRGCWRGAQGSATSSSC